MPSIGQAAVSSWACAAPRPGTGGRVRQWAGGQASDLNTMLRTTAMYSFVLWEGLLDRWVGFKGTLSHGTVRPYRCSPHPSAPLAVPGSACGADICKVRTRPVLSHRASGGGQAKGKAGTSGWGGARLSVLEDPFLGSPLAGGALPPGAYRQSTLQLTSPPAATPQPPALPPLAPGAMMRASRLRPRTPHWC